MGALKLERRAELMEKHVVLDLSELSGGGSVS